MPVCDVCKRFVEKTISVPDADAAICETCLRAGHVNQLFTAAEAGLSAPAEPAAPAASE
ncbi:MAG TPA: hypothetical protein VKF82_06690 [Candidatus Eremiobacteraceae bacterium]|nr:hypothetical protein [Candidatus Eremiobacteraceae bacterium]